MHVPGKERTRLTVKLIGRQISPSKQPHSQDLLFAGAKKHRERSSERGRLSNCNPP